MLSPQVMVQFKYVSGNHSSLILYFLCSILLKRSIAAQSNVATMKSSRVTEILVKEPFSSKLKKKQGS